MAAVQCTKCTAERKGFRRELDSWRHRLVHCVGFECILEGIYGPMLLKDLNLFVDCEPEEVDDWSPEASRSQCSFCNLSLDKLSDPAPVASSPPSSPSDYSPCQALTLSESSQSAHRFLQAVFHKKDVPTDCDSNIPLVAQELMRKMIHQFAVEYASKCLLRTSTNGVTGTSSPLSETPDGPLDLTVSRTVEEKEIEPEPDGVLDLSFRNLANSAVTSSSNHKASGSRLSSFTEEMRDLGRRGTAFCQDSAMDGVLRSLCPAHQSLLYQILKLAHQEQLLPLFNHRQVGQTESHCCHCGVPPQDNIAPHPVRFSECKALGHGLCCPSVDSGQQTQCGGAYHSEASKSSCSIHHHSLRGCNSEGQRGSNYSCVQRCRTESYGVLCSKRLHCLSCQNQAIGRINSIVHSFASSPLLSQSSLCAPPSRLCASVCCTKNEGDSSSCYPNHICLRHIRNAVEKCTGEGDHHCPVLKREQSPSPPPLSPIPTDVEKKADEKPPSLLHHRQGEEPDPMGGSRPVSCSLMVADMFAAGENEPQCKALVSKRAHQNPSGASLQDVVTRFSQKLETITSLDKDPAPISTAIYASEKEQPQFPSTSQSPQCHADAHLTEIITTVLHTGSSSDYSLSELFNKHDNIAPKSPNTRARRRKEVMNAIATRADDAYTRRQTLQIKRDLAMLDQSCNRRKRPTAKRARLKDGAVSVTASGTPSDPDLDKAVSKREIEAGVEQLESHMAGEGTLIELTREEDEEEAKENIQAVIVPDDLRGVSEEQEREIPTERKELASSSAEAHRPGQKSTDETRDSNVKTEVVTETAVAVTPLGGLVGEDCKGVNEASDKNQAEALPIQSSGKNDTLGKDSHSPVRQDQKCQSGHSMGVRRSTRHIVPPLWISSYVTEPRMFFTTSLSEGMSNSTQDDEALTPSILHDVAKDRDAHDTPKSRSDANLSECTKTLPFELKQEEQCEMSSTQLKDQKQMMPVEEESYKKDSPEKETDANDFSSSRRLRSFSKTLQVSNRSENPNMDLSITSTCVQSLSSTQAEYTSPIKLMFVSPVKVKEGIRYSLKSAGSSTQTEHFDPYEESSWGGTPQKCKGQNNGCATSQVKSANSPPKSANSPPKSANSPPKSANSPPKSANSPPKSAPSCTRSVSSPAKSPSSPSKSASSPRSVPSSPKNCLRKSADCTPSKSLSGSEARRSPGDLPPVNETTPPKRRPGRPKKLGPRLEQKAKRPIGRPRKQIAADSAEEAKSSNSKCLTGSDVDDSVNKNLKITVLYGRSRRNKRMVSESFDQLQTDFSDALQKVDIGSDLSILLHRSKTLGTIKRASEELSFASPAMEPAPQSNGNVKFLGQEESTPSRKPGRPAKVKISGISVTVTTVSPRQRKIQLDKDTRQSSETQPHKKALLSDGKSAKDPWTISRQPTSKSTRKEERLEARTQCKDELPHQPAPVRHSMRVRKPSIHFLHAVATSGFRSYSRSNALLRRSKQLLLTKESNERRQEQRNSAEASAEKRRPGGRARATVSQDLSKVAEASVDSIFSPNRTLRWWAPSAEEKTLNQELARRIRVISDTWVADTAEGQEKERTLNSKLDNKGNGAFARKSKHPSVVRMLFDCSPTRPRSCSMQQIRSWFMETTETQSLAIVKKASSRNPYELLHFPRSANKKSTRHSPQAERLRKHVKKFATTVPKSPLQHEQAQQQLRRKKDIRRRLFSSSRAAGKRRRGALWRRRSSSGRYQATLVRARSRFLTCKERKRWQKKLKKRRKEAPCFSGGRDATGPRPGRKASTKEQFSDSFETGPTACSASQTQELVDANKEQKLCSKAWSPETLKECRVFLRKINSPDSESAEEEWESCTVTLDDGSPSAYLFAGQERELVGVVKAVKSEGKGSMSKRTASKEQTVSAVNSVQKQEAVPEERERGKYKSPMGVSAELPQPPPAKTLRQSRMRGLSGPKWCDFVLGN
ncbi:uncharacterized protein lcorl isoform 1-T1 [Menidia menidia]